MIKNDKTKKKKSMWHGENTVAFPTPFKVLVSSFFN